MVNFNVNPDKTNNPPSIIKPQTLISWESMVYGYYNEDGTQKNCYQNIHQKSTGKNIIVSKTTYDESLGYYIEAVDGYIAPFFYFFQEFFYTQYPIAYINMPYGLWAYNPWYSGQSKTWLFNDVVSHVIMVIGPIGLDYSTKSYEEPNGIEYITTTLNFSEDFIVLNDTDYDLSAETTYTKNTITSKGGYAILYFPQQINKLTISANNSSEATDLGSTIKFGLINDLAVFGLDTNVRESKQVTFNIDNNTYDNELITNPVPFEIPEFDYNDYIDKKLVKFNIFEKE